MKNKKLIIFALLIFSIASILTSCNSITNMMNPIVDSIIENADDAHNLNFATITLENDNYTYNGSEFTPEVIKVEVASEEVSKEHYTVSYANNINAGVATVSITAKGDVYVGSKSTTFNIAPKQFSKVTAILSAVHTYTGKEIKPKLTELKDENMLLTESDYDITYENNIDVGENATLTITGKGNYAGSVYFEFSINPLSLDGAIVTLDRDVYSYTGQEHEPTVVKITKDNIDYFIPSENFEISYLDNTEIGTGTAVVTGINNCQGQTVAYFEITTDTVFEIAFTAVDEQEFSSIFALAGAKIQKPIVEGQKYYDINWYTNDTFSLDSRFFFDTMPAQNLTLYGRWEQEFNIKFFAYEDQTPDLSIDSFSELVNLLEYICYNQIITENGQEFYAMNYDYTDLAQELKKAWEKVVYPTTTGYGHTYQLQENGKHKVKIYLVSNAECIFEPTIKAQESMALQYSSINALSIIADRAQDFDDFYIEQLDKSYQASTSNQLYYLLENGLKPNPVADSAADIIYKEAKKVLRQIINNNMTDYVKCMAIYQWLVENITYDYGITEIEQNEWVKYNSFYLEGVFIDNIAVCDGISKAFVVLCQIEGIPCVRVVGYSQSSDNGHAWNKVKIEGQWFIVDPTWGNSNTTLGINTVEYLSYQDFMISDNSKKDVFNCHGVSYTYQSIASIGQNLYYQNNGFVYDELYYDFVIESQEELNTLIKYCDRLEDIENYTINFIIIFDYGSEFNDELQQALNTIPGSNLQTAFIVSKYNKENITLFFN